MIEDRVVDGVILRTCRTCNEESDLESFERSAKCKHGRLYRCKGCRYEVKGERRRARYARLRKAGVHYLTAMRKCWRTEADVAS